MLKVIEAATKAPTGGNSQPVRWMVVRDPDKRRRLGEIYQACWAPVHDYYTAQAGDSPAVARMLRSADHLGERMGDTPVILLPCSRGQVGQAEASVFPGVQNLFLAARALGLGTTLTTVHRLQEADVRAVLGIPEDVITWAMIPLGYPTGRWAKPDAAPSPRWPTGTPGSEARPPRAARGQPDVKLTAYPPSSRNRSRRSPATSKVRASSRAARKFGLLRVELRGPAGGKGRCERADGDVLAVDLVGAVVAVAPGAAARRCRPRTRRSS